MHDMIAQHYNQFPIFDRFYSVQRRPQLVRETHDAQNLICVIDPTYIYIHIHIYIYIYMYMYVCSVRHVGLISFIHIGFERMYVYMYGRYQPYLPNRIYCNNLARVLRMEYSVSEVEH